MRADAVNPGGTIRVSLKCVEASLGEVIELSVADGPGIPGDQGAHFRAVLHHEEGRGYGARAVVSKEIVGRHGGSIEVRSENGSHSGTVFNILLPLASEIREDANKGGGVVGLSLFLISHCS
jgi:nitrogen-specific signal transduction histidine kinase